MERLKKSKVFCFFFSKKKFFPASATVAYLAARLANVIAR
jgi:hypothetical protein